MVPVWGAPLITNASVHEGPPFFSETLIHEEWERPSKLLDYLGFRVLRGLWNVISNARRAQPKYIGTLDDRKHLRYFELLELR